MNVLFFKYFNFLQPNRNDLIIGINSKAGMLIKAFFKKRGFSWGRLGGNGGAPSVETKGALALFCHVFFLPHWGWMSGKWLLSCEDSSPCLLRPSATDEIDPNSPSDESGAPSRCCWGEANKRPNTPMWLAATANCAPTWNILSKYPPSRQQERGCWTLRILNDHGRHLKQ